MKTIEQVRKQRGQGMTEYIIIVALIAVAAIGVYSFFGKSVREQTAGLAQEVAGTDAQEQIDNAQQAGTDAANAAAVEKGLANYNEDNNQQGGGT
jgi:Flp pilus assembly pilin Flp